MVRRGLLPNTRFTCTSVSPAPLLPSSSLRLEWSAARRISLRRARDRGAQRETAVLSASGPAHAGGRVAGRSCNSARHGVLGNTRCTLLSSHGPALLSR
eukprot:1850199-Prymnesium_polylepis.1